MYVWAYVCMYVCVVYVYCMYVCTDIEVNLGLGGDCVGEGGGGGGQRLGAVLRVPTYIHTFYS
jgi:hypothetical protein